MMTSESQVIATWCRSLSNIMVIYRVVQCSEGHPDMHTIARKPSFVEMTQYLRDVIPAGMSRNFHFY